MIRIHLLARQGIRPVIQSKLSSTQTHRLYSEIPSDRGKKVTCLTETASDQQPKCPKTQEEVCKQGNMKVAPLPADCESKSYQPGPIYDPSCVRPYINPCKDFVKTCKSDMVPYPCVSPCVRKKRTVCSGEPDCAYERGIDWGLRGRQIILALGTLLGSLLLYRMYGSEVKVEKRDGKLTKKERRFTRPMEIVRIPESSADIPDNVNYLLIGGGPAAYAAQQAIRSSSKDSTVLIISDAPPYLPSFRPPLSKQLWSEKDRQLALNLEFKGKDKKIQNIVFEPASNYKPVKQLKESPGVGVCQGYHVKKLLPQKRQAILQDGKKITYEKCLLATGGRPRVPSAFEDMEPALLNKVTFYHNSFDFQELEELIQEEGLKCLAVVGGGILGTELALALKERTKDLDIAIVNVVKDGGNMAKILPTYLAKRVTQVLLDRGVKVMTDSVVEEVANDGSNIKLYVTNDHCVTAGHAIVVTGIDPNTDLATDNCIETDPINGGFMVNGEMQLSNGLFAAGDCASFYDCDLGRRREEHHHNAMITGKIAGENMTGKSVGMVVQPTFGTGVPPEYAFEAVGKVDARKCCTVGVFPKESERIVNQEEDEDDDISNLGSRKKKKLKVDYVSNDTKSGSKGIESDDGYDVVKEGEDVENTLANQSFDRGIVYYLNEDQVIIGVLLINMPGNIVTAQALIKEKKTYDDINEVTKNFELHPGVPKIGNQKRARKHKGGARGDDLHSL